MGEGHAIRAAELIVNNQADAAADWSRRRQRDEVIDDHGFVARARHGSYLNVSHLPRFFVAISHK